LFRVLLKTLNFCISPGSALMVEFQRFNGPGVVACLCDGAIPGSAEGHCGCSERGGKAGDKTKIGGNGGHLCISQTSLHDAL
jgi:hypothetical protein